MYEIFDKYSLLPLKRCGSSSVAVSPSMCLCLGPLLFILFTTHLSTLISSLYNQFQPNVQP